VIRNFTRQFPRHRDEVNNIPKIFPVSALMMLGARCSVFVVSVVYNLGRNSSFLYY